MNEFKASCLWWTKYVQLRHDMEKLLHFGNFSISGLKSRQMNEFKASCLWWTKYVQLRHDMEKLLKKYAPTCPPENLCQHMSDFRHLHSLRLLTLVNVL